MTEPAVGASTCASGSQVEGEHRHLDGERQEKGAEEPPGERSQPCGVSQEEGVVEGIRPGARRDDEIQPEDRHQHQERPEHRVDEELDRRVEPALAAPDPDDEVHRDQHHFPHHVEQEQVEGDEDADHPGGEHQEVGVERTLPLGDVAEAPQHRERHEERRQQHHEEGDAVESDVVGDAPAGDPGNARLELHPSRRDEAPPQRDRHGEFDQRRDERHVLRPPLGDEPQRRGGHDRPRQQNGQDEMVVHQRSARERTTTTPTTKTTA